MATHPITGRTLADGTTSPAGWTQDNALEDWLADLGYLVWNFADSAARTAALTLSGKTLGATDRVICFLRTAGTIEVWDGSAWKVLSSLANIGAASVTTSASFAGAGPFSNTSPVAIGAYAWTWTPSKTGLAVISFMSDAQNNAAGWGSFRLQVLRAGAALPGCYDVMYEAGSARLTLKGYSHPIRVTAGVAETITVQEHVYSAAGSAKTNSFEFYGTVVPE